MAIVQNLALRFCAIGLLKQCFPSAMPSIARSAERDCGRFGRGAR
jgi:hypothetical protein